MSSDFYSSLYASSYAAVDHIYHLIWDWPLLVLLFFVSILLTVRLKGMQFFCLPYALKLAILGEKHDEETEGDISHFQSLMTALAATIGIGNIAGVATAVTVGGFGALFWMWVIALLGMAVKFAEAALAVRFREVDENQEMCGGPMYYIEKGLGWKWLAVCFAVLGAFDAFGGGNLIQSHTVADILHDQVGVPRYVSGLSLVLLTTFTLIGGIHSIARVASLIVPVMAMFYMAGGVLALLTNFSAIPGAFWLIIDSAFTGQAATGGFTGASVMLAMQVGLARGVMSSETGLGMAAIAAAAAKTDVPGRQGFVSMTGGFLGTIIMCTVTGLVIAVSDVMGQTNAHGMLLTGAPLTVAAFHKLLPGWEFIVTVGLLFFAFTTILGYAYYGEKCIEYLLGVKSVIPYRLVFIGIILPGATWDLDLVWRIADVTNGLIVIPNLLAIIFLLPMVSEEYKNALAKR